MTSLFQQMSFGQAVDYVRSIGVLINLLLLSVPLFAVVTIVRARRMRPGVTMVFAHVVLWTWVALLLALIAYFFTGRWYSENGPPPQVAAYHVTIQLVLVLLAVGAIHAGLYWTSMPGRQGAAADVDSAAGRSTSE